MVRVNGETGEVSGRLENSGGGAKDNGVSLVKEEAPLPVSPPSTLSSPKKEPKDEMGGRDVGPGAGNEPPAAQEATCVTCLGEPEQATPPAVTEVEATPIRPTSLPTVMASVCLILYRTELHLGLETVFPLKNIIIF